MKLPKYVIFDLDGTLLDSMGMWVDIDYEILARHGKKPKPGLADDLAPMSFIESAEYFKKEYGIEASVEEIVDELGMLAFGHYAKDLPLKRGAAEFLDFLDNSGVKYALATATDREPVMAALKRLGLDRRFSCILTCGEVGKSKTEPDIYFQALKEMDMHATLDDVWIFEDSYHAIITAKRANFYVVGVNEPTNGAADIEIRKLVDRYIADYFDILKSPMKTVLTIAGSDCSGGAGIQADIKTIAAHRLYAMSAITALTAQNTTGVYGIMEVTPEFLEKQLDCIFNDIRPDAVKIGMVSSEELIGVIARKLKQYEAKNIVVDPVMVATSGSRLLRDSAIDALKSELLPLGDVITPNVPEAEVLAGFLIACEEDMLRAAKKITETLGVKAVLIKGGHAFDKLGDKADGRLDLLYANGDVHRITGPHIDNPNTHGTGCTLSSAIACELASGEAMVNAVKKAKAYVTGALAAMLDLGSGSGPLEHTYWLKIEG